jgi:rare lipoprotein A
MIRRLTTTVLALCALAAAPAAHAQDAGGASVPAPTGGVAAVSDGTHSIAARADTLLGKVARFRGTVPAAHAGRLVAIERWDLKRGAWVITARARVRDDGAYLARWRTNTIGRFRVRAVLVSSGSAQASAATPEIAVTVYKPAIATWYGPGFYGNTTACGQEMTKSLVGVAHRTLPCGTQVAITYGGRSMVVPVVDRGPFANGADWDLTYAAAMSLGFTHTDRIGAVRLRDQQPAPSQAASSR